MRDIHSEIALCWESVYREGAKPMSSEREIRTHDEYIHILQIDESVRDLARSRDKHAVWRLNRGNSYFEN